VSIEEGLLVVEVVDGSPADRAGLRPGDVLLTVGGEAVSNLSDLRQALDRHRPGDAVEVEVFRDGRPLTFDVLLGETPAAGS